MDSIRCVPRGWLPVGECLCFCVESEDGPIYAAPLNTGLSIAEEFFKSTLGKDKVSFAWNVYGVQMGGTGDASEVGCVDTIVNRFEIIHPESEGQLGLNVLQSISFSAIRSQGGVFQRLGLLGHPVVVLHTTYTM